MLLFLKLYSLKAIYIYDLSICSELFVVKVKKNKVQSPFISTGLASAGLNNYGTKICIKKQKF